MKSMKTWSNMAVLLLVLMPMTASSHETRVFQIGEQPYRFTVGFLNEPVVVDDKSGVHLIVRHGETEEPVDGLESSLRVEIESLPERRNAVPADAATRPMALHPEHGRAGSYKAVFYPTRESVYSFRFTGSIDEVPVELEFICRPADEAKPGERHEEITLSDGVTQIYQRGAIDCPLRRSPQGFPAPLPSQAEMKRERPPHNTTSIGGASVVAWGGLGLGGLALLVALTRGRKTS